MKKLIVCTLAICLLNPLPAIASSVSVSIEMHVYQPISKKFDRFQVRLGDEFPSRTFLAQKFLSNCKKLTYFKVGDELKVLLDGNTLSKGKITGVKIGSIYYKRYFGEDGETYNEYFAPCIFTGSVSSFKAKGSINLCAGNFGWDRYGNESGGVGMGKGSDGRGAITEISAWWTRISCDGFERPWTFCYKESSSYIGC